MQQPYSEENAHKPTPPRAVSLCGEEISKGKLGSAIVTMDACNSEKLSDLNIEPPDDIERSIPDWVFPTQQNLPTRHQSRPDGMLVMPIEGRGRHLLREALVGALRLENHFLKSARIEPIFFLLFAYIY